MNRTLIAMAFAIFLAQGAPLFAQDPVKNLDEARTAYRSGDLEAARFALQQAIREVDLATAREVLKLLPETMATMPFVPEKEEVGSGAMGFAGVYVHRSYLGESPASASLQVVAGSPLLAGINAILALPVVGRDPDNQRVRIGGYRGLLQRQQGNGGEASWTLQLPFGSSLLTFSLEGIDEQQAVLDMANTIPVEQIARLVQ